MCIRDSSWEGPLVELRPYDLVVSNPPYLTSAEADGLAPGVRDQEPRVALDAGPDGLDSYRALIPGLSRLVDPGAVVLLEVDPSRAGEVAGLCAAVWPRATTQVHRDLSGRNRVVEVTLSLIHILMLALSPSRLSSPMLASRVAPTEGYWTLGCCQYTNWFHSPS